MENTKYTMSTLDSLSSYYLPDKFIGYIFDLFLFTSRNLGQVEVFRRNHLILLAESIKTKQPIVTFLKNNRFLLLRLSNQIYCSKNILLDCEISK